MADLDNLNSVKKSKRGLRTYSAPVSPQVVVVVSREMIDRAEKADSRSCMVADAVALAVPHATNVIVDLATIRFTDADRSLRYVYQTPLAVRDAILGFDYGQHVEPFSFHLRKAWVVAARQHGKARGRMSVAAWRALCERIKVYRAERRATWAVLATEAGMWASSFSSAILSNSKLPSAANAERIETWFLRQVGGAPALRVSSQAHTAAGPERMRKASATIVGGRLPPTNVRYRQFGLRQFVRKPKAEALA